MSAPAAIALGLLSSRPVSSARGGRAVPDPLAPLKGEMRPQTAAGQSLDAELQAIKLRDFSPSRWREWLDSLHFRTPTSNNFLREAEAKVRALNLADQADFTGFRPDTINTLVTAIELRLHEYPELRSGLQFLGTIQQRNERFLHQRLPQYAAKYEQMGLSPAEARQFAAQEMRDAMPEITPEHVLQAVRVDDFRGVAMNEYWATRPEELRRHLLENEKMGYHPKGSFSLQSYLDHEFGHHLDEIYGIAHSPELRALREKYTDVEVVQGLSIYGAKNIEEFVAEGISEYLKGSARNNCPIC